MRIAELTDENAVGPARSGRFGGKGAALAACSAAGLPVPKGIMVDSDAAARVAAGEPAATALLAEAASSLKAPFAVRSSARDEDGVDHSFAGQHLTLLAVPSIGLVPAVCEVVASGASAGARAYRQAHSLGSAVQLGVVIQELVDARCAGVLFTRDPITGTNDVVIEASWGFGVSVVDGLVIPDRVTAAGYAIGDKDTEQVLAETASGTFELLERDVPEPRRSQPCLDAGALAELRTLAARTVHLLDPGAGGLDLEWAFDGAGRLWLLQARPITT